VTDGGNPTAKFQFDVGDETVTVELEFHLSDNVEKFFNVHDLVEGMSAAILRDMM